MSFRRLLIALSVFVAVALALTWLVYATLRREISGDTTAYSAVFTDVFGLRDGDDVRMAGVRVGRVQKIELVNNKQAKVDFVVQNEQKLYGNTLASVTYQNIVGQRYLGLSRGKPGASDSDTVLPEGATIPVERTDPSFDVTTLLNGYEPLFSTLDPEQADNLTKGVIQSLQGDDASIATLVTQTSRLTETFAGRDQALANVITSLNTVAGNLSLQNESLDNTIAHSRKIVSDFDAHRPTLVSAVGSLAQVTRRLSAITKEVNPSLEELIGRQPGFGKHLVGIEPQLAFFGDNLPLVLKGLARMSNEGAFLNVYACDLDFTSFFPGLNDVVPIIVNAATPGNVAQYTPRCRNLANG
ncbi:MlaD family protein [Mycobacteroides chelonae]|uniref:Mammalian cell entry protein n=1 Tax=Mycobacteroides chelonae TaxID=1774 RepID=A0A1S1LZI4_MYCCH|nr:MlaD family protein [Mycobacteroides chelonae]OHU78214.1 mammalian cell entry protein [Mycobacteroides chelonae]QQG86599.1 MCE family protein [Mycobacteroides chelonae]QQG91416.1 MCE family protein [Mycobacteroides chelonae]